MEESYPLPDGWAWTTVGDIVTFQYGKGLTESKRDSSGRIPVYGSNGIVGYHSIPLVENPCLIVGRKGAAGAVHISPTPCWAIDTTYYVIPSENINLHFLYYLFSSLNFNSLDRSTAIPGLNRNDAYAVKIPLPPLPEQERIVAKIEALFTQLDAGTAALKRIQAGLKRYKASVLKAACEGRLVAQDPSDEPAGALLTRMGKQPLEREGLPTLPAGWCYSRIEDISDTIGGITKGRDLSGKQIIRLPYLRVANVQRGWLELGEMKEIDVLVSEVSRYLLQNRDIVLTEGGDWDKLGRSAVWKNQIPNCVHQNHIFRARMKSDEILPEWLAYYTNSELGQHYFKEAGKQTTNLASINLTQLRACPIPIPPHSEQHRIVTEIDRCLSVVQELEQVVAANLQRAGRLRQAILKRAFEGRLV